MKSEGIVIEEGEYKVITSNSNSTIGSSEHLMVAQIRAWGFLKAECDLVSLQVQLSMVDKGLFDLKHKTTWSLAKPPCLTSPFSAYVQARCGLQHI